jgi:hypothetical protein
MKISKEFLRQSIKDITAVANESNVKYVESLEKFNNESGAKIDKFFTDKEKEIENIKKEKACTLEKYLIRHLRSDISFDKPEWLDDVTNCIKEAKNSFNISGVHINERVLDDWLANYKSMASQKQSNSSVNLQQLNKNFLTQAEKKIDFEVSKFNEKNNFFDQFLIKIEEKKYVADIMDEIKSSVDINVKKEVNDLQRFA